MELLHFTADWCNPCKMMEPVIAKFLEENPDIIYTKIDVDKNTEPVKMNNVMSIPTFIAKHDSETSKRHTGAATIAELGNLFS